MTSRYIELTDEQYDQLDEIVTEGEREITLPELQGVIEYLQRRGVDRFHGEDAQDFLNTLENFAMNTSA